MKFSNLSLAVFALLANQIACDTTYTYTCAIDKHAAKDKYTEETEAYIKKHEKIIECGQYFNKGKEAKRQNKYMACINKVGLPKQYESRVVELTNADFKSALDLSKALTQVGVTYCSHIKDEFKDVEPDMEEYTVTTKITFHDIPQAERSGKSKKTKEVEEVVEVEGEEEQEEEEETPKAKAKMTKGKKKKDEDGDSDDDEPYFDGVFGTNKKQPSAKKVSGAKSDDSDAEDTESSDSKNKYSNDEIPFYKSYLFIGSAVFIILLLTGIIIYFCRSKPAEDKPIPPPTPMKPMQPLDQVQKSIQQKPPVHQPQQRDGQNMKQPPTTPQTYNQYQQAPSAHNQQVPRPPQQYQPAPQAQPPQQYQPAPQAQPPQQYQPAPQAQQFQQVPQQYPPPSFAQQYPPQQFPPAHLASSPYKPPNFLGNSQASFASSPASSTNEPPPAYHDVNRPFQGSNPYQKQ